MSREKRLTKEWATLFSTPESNVSASPIQAGDYSVWQATIIGPDDTPYASGVFLLDVHFPEQYPWKPLKINFTTKIYHPNVNTKGEVALDVLYDAWSPAITLKKVLTSIVDLLSHPNLDDALISRIAEQYKHNRKEFDSIARQWTKLYAM